ncbi:S1 family peptidase [Bdellovibrio sp. HCB2-146]|uniref:S1 family peptidase n=1 Tax=Bdellovibrio sp. HCB2-146 TaxID=3394362 RepID=UPI0039BD712B
MNQSKLIFAGVLTGLTLAACAPKGESTQVVSGDSIIGGTAVQKTDKILESIVAVYDSVGGQLCTGSLLENNIVLTAAHCLSPQMYIFFDTALGRESVRYAVDRVAVSSYWEERAGETFNTGDIALIHFKGEVPAGYKPATFLKDKSKLRRGTEVVLAGFGMTDGKDQKTAGTLHMTKVKIADPRYSMSEITVDQRHGTGACHGDSGGPAYLEVDGEYYLWGVTSRGVMDKENNCSQFAAYTSALFYRGWMERMTPQILESLTNLELVSLPATQEAQ